MIVEKVWHTGMKHKFTYKMFRGWFLFGIIPLYVKQIAWQE